MNTTTVPLATTTPAAKRGPGRPRIYPPADANAPPKRPPGRPRLHPLPDPQAVKGKPGRKPEFESKAAWQRAWRAKMIADGYKEVHTWVRVEQTAPAAA